MLTAKTDVCPYKFGPMFQAFLETNIYLLALTFVISIVHSVFEFLAFKNDIQFWNNRSRRSIVTCSVVDPDPDPY